MVWKLLETGIYQTGEWFFEAREYHSEQLVWDWRGPEVLKISKEQRQSLISKWKSFQAVYNI